jgi:hypothetical protein
MNCRGRQAPEPKANNADEAGGRHIARSSSVRGFVSPAGLEDPRSKLDRRVDTAGKYVSASGLKAKRLSTRAEALD